MRRGPRTARRYSGSPAIARPLSRRAPAGSQMRRVCGLVACALAGLAVGATPAGAAGGARSADAPTAASAGAPATCVIHSLPAFAAQGELELQATVADVIEVECNPFIYGTGSKVQITDAQL